MLIKELGAVFGYYSMTCAIISSVWILLIIDLVLVELCLQTLVKDINVNHFKDNLEWH